MKTLTQIALVALAVVLLPLVASASLQVGDGDYVGRAHDPEPANASNEVGYINALITLAPGAGVTDVGGKDYDRIFSALVASFPAAVEAGTLRQVGGNTIDLGTTIFHYILGKYDGPNWGDEVWYSAAGFTGIVELPASWPNPNPAGNPRTGYGLSHISAYNPGALIPEPGTIVVWGLLAVTGYFGMKKWQAKA